MNSFLIYEDGYYYPTTAGTVVLVVLALTALFLAAVLFGQKRGKKAFSVKTLCICAMAIALSFVTSYIRVIKLPYGGSVTLFSMLFICLTGYWYGPKTGLLTGFAYSILAFLQEPYILTPLQVCLDYFFAFTALGISGFFRNRKNGLVLGYLAGALARGLCHTIGGYLFWMSYMPENFPQFLEKVYPIVYNYSYILAEVVLTVAVLSVPAVKKGLDSVGRMAAEETGGAYSVR